MASLPIIVGKNAVERLGAFLTRWADWGMGLGVLGLMLTLLVPLPPQVLDFLLAFNITISVLLLLVTMSVKSSAELSTFPAVLLFTTLFRLGLNVASTRLILSEGRAGEVITAFGHFVVGDDLTVGLIIFLILVVIQFVVITKGAGRISEVAARFVLDAMPGKQMAIDADLNAGLIDSDEARSRRARVASEAEFYGAMDGASKFVRGDAIASLIITALNLLGGITLGTMDGLSLAEAGRRYSMLSIGDGLVTQIPALLVSTAAAVLVTRASSDKTLGYNLAAQIASRPKAAMIAAGMMFTIGLLPGMPSLPFTALAMLLLFVARRLRGVEGQEGLLTASPAAAGRASATTADGVSTQAKLGSETVEPQPVDEALGLLEVDRIGLEIGYRLIPLVKDKAGTGILDHVSQLRRRFASREGVVLPPVRIKDNVRLEPGGYRVLLGGQEIAKGTIEVGQFLAMDSGSAGNGIPKLRGKATRDPAFGLPAWWITGAQRDEAELAGYTVIDPTSVLITHLSEVIRGSLHEILSRDDVKELIEHVKKTSPAVVEELIPGKLGYGEVQQVLRNLLADGVPVRNMPAILEALADGVARTKDPEALSEFVRGRLGRVLCELYADKSGTVHAVTLEPGIEARLAAAVGVAKDPEAAPVTPAYLQKLVERIAQSVAAASKSGKDAVVLARVGVRRFLNELVRASLPKVAVLSYNEVVPARAVETTAVVRLED
ncbi:MAG: flagellar biosynthesis protein FlhA [Planctomycetes bacterium]|nr:flagellar biosynthesis protein FlhA [Planctomycetota bacterium]